MLQGCFKRPLNRQKGYFKDNFAEEKIYAAQVSGRSKKTPWKFSQNGTLSYCL